jgi:hypothetical protein
MSARLTADQVRYRLRMLGQRRAVLGQQHEQLLEDTAAELVLTRGVVPLSEAATLCGIARSTAYVLRGVVTMEDSTVASVDRIVQRNMALKRANKVRVARAEIKRQLGAGEITLAELLEDPPPAAATREDR